MGEREKGRRIERIRNEGEEFTSPVKEREKRRNERQEEVEEAVT